MKTPLWNGNYAYESLRQARYMYGLSGVFNVKDLSDATLSSLALMDTAGGETITLSPSFDAETFTYAAAVSNTVDEVSLTVTKTDSLATVIITDDSDTSTPSHGRPRTSASGITP